VLSRVQGQEQVVKYRQFELSKSIFCEIAERKQCNRQLGSIYLWNMDAVDEKQF
jgi:hypothetical protein